MYYARNQNTKMNQPHPFFQGLLQSRRVSGIRLTGNRYGVQKPGKIFLFDRQSKVWEDEVCAVAFTPGHQGPKDHVTEEGEMDS